MLSEAVASNPADIVYLSRGQAGTRSATIARFLLALGAQPASTTGFGDFTIERKAAELVFGWRGLPVYEMQDATYVLGIGADFLGGWVSPVLYARRFGHMRQGRPALRGSLYTFARHRRRFSRQGCDLDARIARRRPSGLGKADRARTRALGLGSRALSAFSSLPASCRQKTPAPGVVARFGFVASW
jgi:hypothetical protein